MPVTQGTDALPKDANGVDQWGLYDVGDGFLYLPKRGPVAGGMLVETDPTSPLTVTGPAGIPISTEVDFGDPIDGQTLPSGNGVGVIGWLSSVVQKLAGVLSITPDASAVFEITQLDYREDSITTSPKNVSYQTWALTNATTAQALVAAPGAGNQIVLTYLYASHRDDVATNWSVRPVGGASVFTTRFTTDGQPFANGFAAGSLLVADNTALEFIQDGASLTYLTLGWFVQSVTP
jgi:hypothetical protein